MEMRNYLLKLSHFAHKETEEYNSWLASQINTVGQWQGPGSHVL